MLDKLKELGAQVAAKATDAVDGLSGTVKGGIESLTDTASELSGAISDKAVRTSTAQMCRILELAIEELGSRALASRPVTLTSSVHIGLASLEMQIHLPARTVDAGDEGNGSAARPLG
jgi:hypothetical protein